MRFLQSPDVIIAYLLLMTCIGCAFAFRDLQTDDYKKYFTPEVQIIEPSVRKGSPGKFADIAPCGGIVSPGTSSFVAAPDTHGFFKWKTIHPDMNGM